jgi:hypothetical protein
MKPAKKGKKEIKKSVKRPAKKIIKKVIKKETKRPLKKETTKKEMKKIVSKSKETLSVQKKQASKPAVKEISYVELRVKCNECGKESKIVILEGSDTSDYLCPKCSTGDFFEEDDDFG